MLNKLYKFALLVLTVVASLSVYAESETSTLTGSYWFDFSGERYPIAIGSSQISTDGLAEGLHTIHAYVDDGVMQSSTHTAWFLKTLGTLKAGDEVKYSFFVDGEPYLTQTVPYNPDGLQSVNLDMNAVSPGVHSITVTAMTPAGQSMGYRNGIFLRVPTDMQRNTFKAYYYLDGVFKGTIDTSLSSDCYRMDIDASQLQSGLHSVTVYLASPLGLATMPLTSWFVKIPKGGEGIVSYEYWLNDEFADSKLISLDKTVNPLKLIELIDMPVRPFSSMRFSFAIEDGTPYYYGMNDFGIRFRDPEGRSVSSVSRYVDARVKYEVSDVTTLEPNVGNIVPTLGNNQIKWYSYDVELGDSLGVRMSRAATLDVFSPRGEKVLSVTGADAITYKSFTTAEKGTYYFAVHDVAKGMENAEFHFTFVPHFAFCSQTPTRSANRGHLIMSVEGNGYDYLKTLVLKAADGTEYTPSHWDKIDNNHLVVQNDMEHAPIPSGEYYLYGTFEKDGKNESATGFTPVRVENAEEVILDVDVETPRIASTPYLCYVKVTNKSNVGCWGIPLNIAVLDNPDNPFDIDFIDFYIGIHKENVGKVDGFYHTDDLYGTGKPGTIWPLIIPVLKPDETLTLTLGMTTKEHQIVELFTSVGKPWSEEIHEMQTEGYDFDAAITEYRETGFITIENIANFIYEADNGLLDTSEGAKNKKGLFAPGDRPSCNRNPRESAEAAIGVASHGLDIAGHGSQNILNLRNTNTLNMMNANGVYPTELVNMVKVNHKMMASADDIVQAGDSENLLEGLWHLLQARRHWKEAVKPIYGNKYTPVDNYQSGDPNDMKGYESPGGTKHIGTAVKSVTYTIEFENDPVLANAPASTISVESQLDVKKVNVATFRPLTLTIGNKETELPDSRHFVKTVDMRPEINAIAELTFDLNESDGKMSWKLRSLNPMTMDPVSYMDDGILPVNDDTGRGTGYLHYSVDLVKGLADGTEISAGATIIFDNNEPIPTPVWTNITDYTLPTSALVSRTVAEDGLSVDFEVDGSDTGSGIWYYDLYMRPVGADTWTPVMMHIDSDRFTYRSDTSVADAQFAVLAVDRAGNRQSETAVAGLAGDADGNGVVNVTDIVTIINYYTKYSDKINIGNADVNNDGNIDILDVTGTVNIFVGKSAGKMSSPEYLDRLLKSLKQIGK